MIHFQKAENGWTYCVHCGINQLVGGHFVGCYINTLWSRRTRVLWWLARLVPELVKKSEARDLA